MKNVSSTLKKISIRYVLSTLFLSLFLATAFGQLPAGVYTVGASGDYASLTEAFDAIKSDSILGDIVLELENSHVESGLVIDGIGYAEATITIRPAAGAQFVLFDGRTHITGGSVNILFDGRPGGSGEAFPGGNGVMIFRESNNANANGAIHQQAAGALTVRYAEVRADSKYGIYAEFANTLTVENCRIKSFQNGYIPNAGNLNTEAIRTLFTGGNITIRNNRINGWRGSEGFNELGGIFMLHPNQAAGDPVTWIIENNAIVLDKPAGIPFCMGIRLNTNNGWTFENNEYKVRHNTILLLGANSSDAETAVTGAFSRQANAALPAHSMEVKNNIFVNRIQNAGGQSVSHGALWIRADAGGVLENADFDHNNYFSSQVIASVGNPASSVEYASLADWQAFAMQDENTTDVQPTFTDPATGNLALQVPTDGSERWFLGTGLGVTRDINGAPRKPATPTKGAYEVALSCIPAGVYRVAADVGSPGNADYASLQDAFQAIADRCLDGDIVLELESGFSVDNLTLDGAGDLNYSVTIRPAVDALFVLFSGRTYITGGSENIIFDGRPGGSGEAFPAGNGVMIFRESSNTNGNAAIHHQAAGALTVRFADIRSDARYGILSAFTGGGLTVENCRITSFQNGYSDPAAGTEYLRTLFANGNITIRNNRMYGLKVNNQAPEAVGMLLIHPQSSTDPAVTWIVENNSIEVTKPAATKFSIGIRLNTPNGWTNTNDVFRIRHNTVLLRGTNTNTEAGAVSSAFYRFANAPLPPHTMEVKNNILVNRIEGGAGVSHAAVWIRADAGGVLENADIDYNNYASAANVGAFGNPDAGLTAYASLADWQDFASQDANTTNVQPTFINPDNGNLAIDPASLASGDLWVLGTALGIARDINGADRSGTTPTKGAYEQNVVTTSLRQLVDVSSTLRVFPNPAGDYLSLQMDNTLRGPLTISVVNLLGQELRRFTTEKAEVAFQTALDLRGLPAGVLAIVATDGRHLAVRKIIHR